MKVLSQESQTVVSYDVHKGEWEPRGTGAFDLEYFEIMEPGDKVDERTTRVYFFNTMEEATTYAEKIIADNTGGKWLAYVEIKKATIEVIKTYRVRE